MGFPKYDHALTGLLKKFVVVDWWGGGVGHFKTTFLGSGDFEINI